MAVMCTSWWKLYRQKKLKILKSFGIALFAAITIHKIYFMLIQQLIMWYVFQVDM